jgi:nucleoside-diphosphate-sugar epimerase
VPLIKGIKVEIELRTLILGMDGYIGWGLAMHLSKRGHLVSGVDNFARRADGYSKRRIEYW